ncbi:MULTISPECIES: SRPBCC family protein [Pseudonocardia]|uniref:Polyketide cyclase / dehydrase and lipid transport n=2 Tax=Pseudonocardia TaxID=1847 RepID=A0A1Y2N2W3_PSEAH|nr:MULTISPECIES: SRPBCC family protein [Pseudonocardia]OSY41447.1 hypothetical protein BG845_01938 [Pseudonocardia autotrophica]TDN71404.1 hypothetical protein C8E95_0434 [Pseudonocardia autotrophica]BBG02080.1 hypothetical protein Pdca_32890 [Pseudonocardia autotrophica]GEC24094.1 hypothetical protein PSA01_11230 [Pseudonocardia saturnea]
MRVHNVHTRELAAPIEDCAALIDDLASARNRLWPDRSWPAMRFHPGLVAGAHGGHGPLRYVVQELDPGRRVRFRFTRPRGFHDAVHEFLLEPVTPERTRLVHTLSLTPRGTARITWPLLFRPLHDALLEDALDNAENALCATRRPPRSRSLRVRILRAVAARSGGVTTGPQHEPVTGGVIAPAAMHRPVSFTPSYVDRFVLCTDTDTDAGPRQWATAAFEEGISRFDRDLVFTTLLGLRPAADGIPGSIAGWAITSEDDHHVRIETSSSGAVGALLIERRGNTVSLTTALAFSSTVRAAIWRVLSHVHRSQAAPTLRNGSEILRRRAGTPG